MSKSKNWQAIRQVTDTHFRWALAMLDLATDFGLVVAERFPEYFSDEQTAGPVPLSVLNLVAEKNCCDGNPNPKDNLVTYGAIPKDWPIFNFGDAETIERYGDSYGFRLIPKELEAAVHTGAVYEWEGKQLVLVDRVIGVEWQFVPAELVDVSK